MTGSAMKCNGMEMDVVLGLLLGENLKKGREFEGGGLEVGLGRRSADDGKRSSGDGRVVLHAIAYEKGRGLGRGRARDCAGPEAGG